MNVADEMKKVAKTLMLDPSPELLRVLCRSWDNIMRAVRQLDEIDKSSVSPLVFPNPCVSPNLRSDVLVKTGFDPTVTLKNAPHNDKGYIIVPRVVLDAE